MQIAKGSSLPSSESIGAPFRQIYASDLWTLGSGPGSLPVVNRPFIAFLETFIRENRIANIVDFGCGDWQYMSHVDLGGANYLGLDVVNQILVENTQRYGRPNVRFAPTPADLSNLPKGDLIIFKDVLVHLPNDYVAKVLGEARRKYRFLIAVNNVSSEPDAYNSDIKFGGFRPVDIALSPFSIPCATVLRLGPLRIPDPRLPWLFAVMRRRFVWPGLKHVQLAFGCSE
jgi:hypothetical protein